MDTNEITVNLVKQHTESVMKLVQDLAEENVELKCEIIRLRFEINEIFKKEHHESYPIKSV